MASSYDIWKTTDPRDDGRPEGGEGFQWTGRCEDDHHGAYMCLSCGEIDGEDYIEVEGVALRVCGCGNSEEC